MSSWTDYLIEVTCPDCGEIRKVYKYNYEKRRVDLCRKCFVKQQKKESLTTLTCAICGIEKVFKKGEAKQWVKGICLKCSSKINVEIARKAHLAQSSGVTYSHDGYVYVKDREHPLVRARGYVSAHWKVVYDIVGDVADPSKGHQIHHVDGNPKNNAPNNLVLCQDNAYHSLLHARAKAFYTCGDVNKRQCYICKEYDLPENMKQVKGKGSHWHHSCELQKRALEREAARQKVLASDGSQDQNNTNPDDGKGE